MKKETISIQLFLENMHFRFINRLIFTTCRWICPDKKSLGPG